MSSTPPIRWRIRIKRETTTSGSSTVRRAPCSPLMDTTLTLSVTDRRLRVLARLRGKEPTPEPEPQPGSSTQGDSGQPTGRLQHVQSWR